MHAAPNQPGWKPVPRPGLGRGQGWLPVWALDEGGVKGRCPGFMLTQDDSAVFPSPQEASRCPYSWKTGKGHLQRPYYAPGLFLGIFWSPLPWKMQEVFMWVHWLVKANPGDPLMPMYQKAYTTDVLPYRSGVSEAKAWFLESSLHGKEMAILTVTNSSKQRSMCKSPLPMRTQSCGIRA